MVIFWLGVLTGALLVGLVFAYRYLNSAEYRSALLKTPTYTKTTQVTSPAANYGIGDPSPPGNPGSTRGIGDPGPPGNNR